MAWLRQWIPNQGVLGSKSLGGSMPTQLFILPSGDLVVPSKLSLSSGSAALSQLNIIHKKGP